MYKQDLYAHIPGNVVTLALSNPRWSKSLKIILFEFLYNRNTTLDLFCLSSKYNVLAIFWIEFFNLLHFHCGWRKSSCLGRFRRFAKKLATLSHVDSTSTFSVLSGLSHIFWTLETLRAVFGVPLSSSYVCLLRGSLNASHCLCHGYWCIGYT